MTAPTQSDPPSVEAAPPKRKGRGCFFYGCLTFVILFLIVVLGIYFGVRYTVNAFTQNHPIPLPQVHLTADQMSTLTNRIHQFASAVHAGQPAAPLVLNGEELNALIESNPNLRKWKNAIYLNITNGEIESQVSMPLEKFGLSTFKGRYLNGSARLSASLQNGSLNISFQSLNVNGKQVSTQAMAQIRAQNLGADFNQNPQTAAFLHKLKSIEVQDNHLTVTPKKSK